MEEAVHGVESLFHFSPSTLKKAVDEHTGRAYKQPYLSGIPPWPYYIVAKISLFTGHQSLSARVSGQQPLHHRVGPDLEASHICKGLQLVPWLSCPGQTAWSNLSVNVPAQKQYSGVMVSAPRKHTSPPGELENTPMRVKPRPSTWVNACETPRCQAL